MAARRSHSTCCTHTKQNPHENQHLSDRGHAHTHDTHQRAQASCTERRTCRSHTTCCTASVGWGLGVFPRVIMVTSTPRRTSSSTQRRPMNCVPPITSTHAGSSPPRPPRAPTSTAGKPGRDFPCTTPPHEYRVWPTGTFWCGWQLHQEYAVCPTGTRSASGGLAGAVSRCETCCAVSSPPAPASVSAWRNWPRVPPIPTYSSSPR